MMTPMDTRKTAAAAGLTAALALTLGGTAHATTQQGTNALTTPYPFHPDRPSIAAVCAPDGVVVSYQPIDGGTRNVQIWQGDALTLNRTSPPPWHVTLDLEGPFELRYAGDTFLGDAARCEPATPAQLPAPTTVPAPTTTTTAPEVAPPVVEVAPPVVVERAPTTTVAPPAESSRRLAETGGWKVTQMIAAGLGAIMAGAVVLMWLHRKDETAR